MHKEWVSTYITALSSLKIKGFLDIMRVNIEIPDLLDQWFSDNQIRNCFEAAEIGALCLKRFSYITRVVQVWYTGGTIGNHAVCAYMSQNKWWVCADNLKWLSEYASVSGHISAGPYNSLYDIAKTIAWGKMKKWRCYKV